MAAMACWLLTWRVAARLAAGRAVRTDLAAVVNDALGRSRAMSADALALGQRYFSRNDSQPGASASSPGVEGSSEHRKNRSHPGI